MLQSEISDATAWTPSHQKFRSLKEADGVLYTFSLKQGF